MEITPAGDSALIVRICDDAEAASADCSAAVLRACRVLRSTPTAGVIELAPAYGTVAVFYDPLLVETDGKAEWLSEQIRAALAAGGSSPRKETLRTVDIPVCYDGEFAPDLPAVAAHTGLAPGEVVRRHSEPDYRVQCVGFTPGFPYLAGLPAELSMPRRATPRKQVPAGSVAIGGSQTGIYPFASPGGWNIIGRTPLQLFSAERPQPALLRAGDRVRFIAMTREEFDGSAR